MKTVEQICRGICKRTRGFTLIELMITVAIVAILAAIAVPSYRQYVIRSNRSAAEAAMMDIANREQQFFAANRGYADSASLGLGLPPDVDDNYDCDVAPGAGSLPSFLITCTPQGAQAGDGVLTLDNLGTKTPSAKWKG